MSISSARGRDLWELPECDAPLALTGVSAKGKGAGGGVYSSYKPQKIKNKPRRKCRRSQQGVTPDPSNPSCIPAAVPRARSLLPGWLFTIKGRKKKKKGTVWSAHPDFLPPALFLFSPLKKELYPLTLPCPGLARNPQHLGASRQPTAAGREAGRRPGLSR